LAASRASIRNHYGSIIPRSQTSHDRTGNRNDPPQPEQVCYVGDDLSDLSLMTAVGLGATVADGVEELKAVAHIKTKQTGGTGAIRELVEMILKKQDRWGELMQTYCP